MGSIRLRKWYDGAVRRRVFTALSVLSLVIALVTFILGVWSDTLQNGRRLEWRGRVYAVGLVNGRVGFDNEPDVERFDWEYGEVKNRLNTIHLGRTLKRLNPRLDIPDPNPREFRALVRRLHSLDRQGSPPLVEHRAHYLVVVGLFAVLPAVWCWRRQRPGRSAAGGRPRAWRWAFPTAAAASLLLCAGVVILWVRSYFKGDLVEHSMVDGWGETRDELYASRGGVRLTRWYLPAAGSPAAPSDLWNWSSDPGRYPYYDPASDGAVLGPSWQRRAYGFQIGSQGNTTEAAFRWVTFPFVAPAIVLALVPLAWLLFALRRRLRGRANEDLTLGSTPAGIRRRLFPTRRRRRVQNREMQGEPREPRA
jgi:hypothetical protein